MPKKIGRPHVYRQLTGRPISDLVIGLRQRRGLSQEALGRLVGKSGDAVKSWEDGLRTPDGSTLILLRQLEAELDSACGGAGGPQKHRSINERLRRAKSTAAKRETALKWADNWRQEQRGLVDHLIAADPGRRPELLRELSAVTDKRLGALPRVIELLLEGVVDVDEDME